ncbi:MAG TPA: hypothetical protein PKK48_09090 [Phycisphaerae bacterium]|nr:hypothetical protein [Phycisphaerae bacterium]
MSNNKKSSVMFALSGMPPAKLDIAGRPYCLEKVFKHDFWAAACLYVCEDISAQFQKIVVKFGRECRLGPLPMKWIGCAMVAHECDIYGAMSGMDGVPVFIGRLSPTCFAIEYIDGEPLDYFDCPPAGFFDRLREVFGQMHRRGIAYVDANKRSNIIVRLDGRPVVIDFQISLRKKASTFFLWPFIKYMQGKDVYHILKHKRRLSPSELTSEELEISTSRTGFHWLHRKLTKPYRALRRRFLNRKYKKGQLISPTAELETHHQPEKDFWRYDEED